MNALHCPFDKAELQERSEYHNERWYQCSKCGLNYTLTNSQEAIDWEAKKYVENWSKKLRSLEQEKSDILGELKIAKDAGLLDDFSALIE